MPCYRCGRRGNNSSQCYARFHISGAPLQELQEEAVEQMATATLESLVFGSRDVCRKCGRTGHFSSQCHARARSCVGFLSCSYIKNLKAQALSRARPKC